MKKFFLLGGLFICKQLAAQLPEDALRVSWTTPSGTARQQAIGGAMGSLGGEISAAFVNPAGLGLYKTGEIVISPGFRMLRDKSNYRGGSASGNTASSFNLGASGLVIGYGGQNGNSNAFSIAVNQTANFNSNIYYKGQNNYSSLAEQYAEEFARSGLTPDQGLSSTNLSYGTRMALYTYLIDTASDGRGGTQVIAQPQKAGLLNQENTLRSRGGITEIAISLATNMQDKWYLGATLGVPIISYTRYQTYRESDATGNTNNDFDSFTYNETYTSKGVGLNGRLGLIFKPANAWRVGFALHTPTLFGLTDKVSASMVTRTEHYTSRPQISITSDSLDRGSGTNAGTVNYSLNTPWKFILSGSYLFGGESENVKQQKGFITMDLEYITHNSSRFHPTDPNTDPNYYKSVNSVIKSYYKGVFDARLGGELKFNTFMARAGAAWYGNPYTDKNLKADRLYLSGGLGYRNKGIFIDLTYVQGFTKDVSFPYRLTDKPINSYASIQENGGTLVMTVGFKF